MQELIYILLPVVVIIAYYIGSFKGKSVHKNKVTRFSRSYLTTVDLLLSNKQKKAVKLISDLVNKPLDGESSVDQNSIDALLFLANLYKTTGELDKSLNNYHKILVQPNLDSNIEQMVRNYVAQCYFKIGIYNRAEDIFLDLKNDPDYYYSASKRLIRLYIATKEWRKALILTKELDKREPTDERKQLLAILYCFHLDEIQESLSEAQIFKTFNRILALNPENRLAHILLARYYTKYNSYQFAIDEYDKVINKDPGILLLINNHIKQIFIETSNIEKYFDFLLKKAIKLAHKIPLCLYAQEIIKQRANQLDNQQILVEEFIAEQQRVTNLLFDRFALEKDLDYLIIALSLNNYSLQRGLLNQKNEQHQIAINQGLSIKDFQLTRFQCRSCGYRTKSILWICPNCRTLDSFKVPENKLN